MIEQHKLQGLSFFNTFTEKQVERLASLMDEVILKKGEFLIEQDSLNLNLYFLLAGKVDIIIDGEPIEEIAHRGEVFGEVGIASHQTSTASVRVARESTFAMLSFNTINGLKDALIEARIFRAIAEIIAIKLIKTNTIAKTYQGFIDGLK